MRHLLCFLMFFLPTVAFAHPLLPGTPAHQEKVAQIVAFRAKLVEAVTAKDVVRLRMMYADEFIHTHTSAKTDGKDQRIVSLLAGDPVIENAPVEDLVVRISHSGQTGIVTGVSPIKSMADGKVYGVRWTAVYTLGDAGWQLSASQATRGQAMPQ